MVDTCRPGGYVYYIPDSATYLDAQFLFHHVLESSVCNAIHYNGCSYGDILYCRWSYHRPILTVACHSMWTSSAVSNMTVLLEYFIASNFDGISHSFDE